LHVISTNVLYNKMWLSLSVSLYLCTHTHTHTHTFRIYILRPFWPTTKSGIFKWPLNDHITSRNMQLHFKIYITQLAISMTKNIYFNFLKPTGYVMHHQFNIQQLYALPIPYSCVLRINSDLCHLQHKLIGFYNWDEKCLQRGTDWGFK
jgi:hypothetical protein